MGIIHVRWRESDSDVAAWYEQQTDKSRYVRDLIRADMMRVQDGDSVSELIARALDALPEIVRSAAAAAVREALSSCQLAAPISEETTGEDPELAARLDEQLGDFFGDCELEEK